MTFIDANKQPYYINRKFEKYGAFKASLKKSCWYFLTCRRIVKDFCEDSVKFRNTNNKNAYEKNTTDNYFTVQLCC